MTSAIDVNESLLHQMDLQFAALRRPPARATIAISKRIMALLTLAKGYQHCGRLDRQRQVVTEAEKLAFDLLPDDPQRKEVDAARRAVASGGPIDRDHRLPPVTYAMEARTVILERIREALASASQPIGRRLLALTGSPTSGVSAVSVAYGRRYQHDYDGRVYVLTPDSDRIMPDVAELCSGLGIPVAHTMEATAATVIKHLEDGPRSLFILDGLTGGKLPDLADLEQWLPCNSDVLMAGHDGVPAPYPTLSVPSFSREEAIGILTSLATRDQQALLAIPRAIDAVGSSPLGVTLLTAYASRTPDMDWETLAERLSAKGSSAGAVDMLIDHILSLASPNARRGLAYSALLPDTGFPKVWLIMLLEGDVVSADNDEEGNLPDGTAGVADELVMLGLLEYRSDSVASISVPPQVAMAVDRLNDLQPAPALDAIEALAEARGFLCRHAATLPASRWEIQPLCHLARRLWDRGRTGAALRLANRVQESMRHLGRIQEAITLLCPLAEASQRLHRGSPEMGPAEAPERVAVLNNYAMVLLADGQLLEAIRMMTQSMRLADEALPPGDPLIATTNANLAAIQHEMGGNVAAESLLKTAIAEDTATLGSGHPNIASHYANLAMILQDDGKLQDAERAMRTALEIASATLPEDHPTLASYYVNLGSILKMRDRVPEAEQLTRRAAGILERNSGGNHPDLAVCYSNLALFRQRLSDLAGALALMEKAIAIDEKTRRPEHPRLAVDYANLAAVLCEAGDLRGAESNIERAEQIAGQSLGQDHPTTQAIRRWRAKFNGSDAPGPYDNRGDRLREPSTALVRVVSASGTSRPVIVTDDVFSDSPGVGYDALLTVAGTPADAARVVVGGGQRYETVPVLDLARPRRRPGRISQGLKRSFDLVFGFLGLILTLPLWPFIALAISIEDGFPVLFKHRREGMGGREFGVIKFRTMRKNAEKLKQMLLARNLADGPQFFMESDPRITRVGRFLRRTRLDELPQFVNVVLGQMSLVGPRPSPHSENQFAPAWREARLRVRPGMTGLWQTRRTHTAGTDFQEWIRYDIEYVERQSFWFDMRIIASTIAMSVRGLFRRPPV